MKKLVVTSIILICSSFAFTGNDMSANKKNDHPKNVTEIRFKDEETDKIEKIEVSTSVRVVATDMDESFVAVSGDYDDVQKIKTEIRGNTLSIFLDGNIHKGEDLKIEVGLRSSLKEITVSESSVLEIKHESNDKDLSITVSNSSRIEGSISSKDNIELNASKSSRFDGELISNNLNISSSQSSSVEVTGSSNLGNISCKKSSRVDLKKFENTDKEPNITSDMTSRVDFAAKY